MANKILHKRSGTTSNVPSAGSLDYGEIAINYADEKLFIKNSSDQVVEIGGASGGIASIQSGFVSGVPDATGTSGTLDASYIDITITSVDVNKAVVVFEGAFTEYSAGAVFGTSTSFDGIAPVMARLTSATNLRISAAYSHTGWYFNGQWKVIEGN